MAKSKQSGSAAQRRAQERQQRQRREETRVTTNTNRGAAKVAPKRRKDRSGLYMILGVSALLVLIVAAFVFVSHQPATQTTNTNSLLKPTAANMAVVQQLTGVKSSTWEAIGTGGVKNPFQVMSGQPALKGPHGYPEVLYVGGEYCPYCAAQRWAIINALSRFGTFSKLSQMQSYEDNISTFSFYGSSYTSQYVDFSPVEVYGNGLDNTQQAYVQLQKMSADQQKIFTQYDGGGSFPFADINNQYILVGASYSPTILLDSSSNAYSWQMIASALNNTKSPIAQAVLGTANYMTAAICTLTNQQPGSVCNAAAIQQIQHSLNKTSSTAGSVPLTLAPADLSMVRRPGLM